MPDDTIEIARFGPLRVGYALTFYFLDDNGLPRQIQRGRYPMRERDVSVEALRPADIASLRAELLNWVDDLDAAAGRFEDVKMVEGRNLAAISPRMKVT